MANSGTVKAVPKINKHNIHNPASLSVNSKRGGEEVALLTGIPEMSGTNLGLVDGYFVSILWL